MKTIALITTATLAMAEPYAKVSVGNNYVHDLGLTDNTGSASCQLCTPFSIDNAKTGLTKEISLGYDLDKFSVDISASQRNNVVNDYDRWNTGWMLSKIQNKSVMLNGYFHPVEYKGFKPYIGFGVGKSWNKLGDISQAINHSGNVRVDQIDPGHEVVSKAYQKMFGIKYTLTKNVSVDLMYRNFNGGRMYSVEGLSWTNYTGNYVTNGVGCKNGKYSVDEVLIGVEYKF